VAIQNGYLDATLLTAIPWSPNFELRPGAVAALAALSARYRARFGVDLPVVYAYRTYAEQVRMYAAYLAGTGNLAARPGTSTHGLGIAIDAGAPAGSWGTPQQAWLRANAGPTWVFEVAIEPWHLRFTGNPDAPYVPPVTPPVPVVVTPPAPQEDPDMIVIQQTSSGRSYSLGPGFLKHHSNASERGVALLQCHQTDAMYLSDQQTREALWNVTLPTINGRDPGAGEPVDPLAALNALPPGGRMFRTTA
jgi:hypothetical protein